MGVRKPDNGQARRPVELTPAEARVLPLLATHLTLSAIGEQLGVCRSTVKTQVMSIYRKFGVTSRAQAVERAVAGGYLEIPSAARLATRG